MTNYHVADFALRIKNAYMANRKTVTMPYSNINLAIAKVLVKEGFLSDVKKEEVEEKNIIKASLRYQDRRAVVHGVEIISKPSLRVYVDAKHVGRSQARANIISVLSTNQGIMTGKDAKQKGVGGELLFAMW
jgi:small subunit ribosomal protein S8